MSAGEQAMQLRPIQDVSRVELRDFGELRITQGDEESLTVEGDARLLPRVWTEVRQGTLFLQVGRSWPGKFLASILPPEGKGLRYRLMLRTLLGVRLEGACSMKMAALKTPSLALRASDLASMELSAVEARTLEVVLKRGGEIEIAGQVHEQIIRVTGVSAYIADQLISQRADVNLRDASLAMLHVEEQLRITISGIGRVAYRGEPDITRDITGAGSVQMLT